MNNSTRAIDPKFYGVSGYSNVPGYNIPYRATGHLMVHPARDTHESLCGEDVRNLHERVVKDARSVDRPWSKVCARCTKIAERDGLKE